MMIADHQPPNRIVQDAQKARGVRGWYLRLHSTTQRFFPQCHLCSKLQAKTLKAAKPPTTLVLHNWLLRNPQLLLAGMLLAYFNRPTQP